MKLKINSWLISGLLSTMLLVPQAGAQDLGQQEELLEPDKAFALSTRAIDANTLEASWKVAKGYYLYRDKFVFAAKDNAVRLLAPVFPKGKIKDDQFFGKIETYLDAVTVRLPIERLDPAAKTAVITITAQGCNEPIGVCYPPMTKDITFTLPAAAASTTSPKISSLSQLKQVLGESVDEPEFLEPDQAFQVAATPEGPQMRVSFVIAPGYYLYHDKIEFGLLEAGGARIAGTGLPKGKVKDDPYFGKVEIHQKSFDALLTIEGAAAANTQLQVTYQGCAEKGICYPPITKTYPLATGATAVSTDSGAGKTTTDAETVDTKTYWLAVLGAFVTGLILTFTPCVLPMIPILSSVIVGAGDINKMHSGMLAVTYVVGTTVTYTAAGVFAGLTGEQLQAYFQNVWAIGIFATILTLLALSMFGFYEIQMPSFVQSRLTTHSQKIKGGSFVGVFIMGLISALIVGACVSPLLISALGVAIVSKDPVLGGLIMFSMGLGMGVILIAIGFGAGFLLPKAGMWMERVKHFFGVMLIGVAIYLLGVLPQVPVLLLWAALLIITSIYFGAMQPVPEGAGGWRYFWKGFGTLLLAWGVLALIGGMSGNRDILRPVNFSQMASSTPGTTKPAHAVTSAEEVHLFKRISNEAALEQALADARSAGKPVILDFFATWCTDCVRMENLTFRNPAVQKAMGRFVLLQVDVTDPNDEFGRSVKKRFNVFGPPAMLFFDQQGNPLKSKNFYGFKNTEDFLVHLEDI